MDAPLQILLSGPPGVGKTTVGRALAERWHRPFLDLDEETYKQTGESPARLIRERGEDAFRTLELETLRGLPRGAGVLALGGGTLLGREARAEARSRGVVVGLHAPPEVLLERLVQDQAQRPILEGEEGRASRLAELLAERALTYRSVDLRVDAGGEPDRVAMRILECACELRVRLCSMGGHRTRVLLGRELADAVAGAVSNLGPKRTCVLLADPGVPPSLRDTYLDGLSERLEVFRADIPGGEACKTWGVLEAVLEAALAAGAGRQSVVVGLGGGATLDLAGMVAALLGRGAPLVLIPTTLLAQVDASVGGKCAINSRTGRNLVGAFHPATDVVVDLEFLRSLSSIEYRSGLVEVLKMGLIADSELFRSVAEHGEATLDAIDRALGLKCELVERDPKEAGDRMLLNLGHTLGHALELASNYTLPHGVAVAHGIVAIAKLSAAREGLAPEEAEEVIDRVSPFISSPLPTEAEWTRALSHIRSDKKGDKDGIELIVLPKIGRAARRRVSWSEIEGAWRPFGGAS